ncbi:MAG: hypothetical protein ACE5KX_08080 [Acidimicrobiia bacterium]
MEDFLGTYLPLVTSVITFVFAGVVLRRWARRRPAHLLLWGIGLVMYGWATLMEALFGAFGWHHLFFRFWYFFGAVLVAAWLGQGTGYLLVRRRLAGVRLAHVFMVVLAVGSIFAGFRVFSAELDPSLMLEGELSGHAITTSGVRLLTPFFNTYGVIMLVGGAIYSAAVSWRQRILVNRTIGNVLIAAGAMGTAVGGSMQRYGVPVALYVGEFIGAVLMFLGFLYVTGTLRQPAPEARQPALMS